MKYKDIIKYRILFVTLLLAAGCTSDPTDEPKPKPDPDKEIPEVITNPKTANQWIYKYLSEWYLWNGDIKATKNYDFDLEYRPFFESMLSKNRHDGHWSDGSGYFYSYVRRDDVTGSRTAKAENTAGFEFGFVVPWVLDPARPPRGIMTYPLIVVHYVVPGSDADGKLKRGDIICGINGVKLTWDNMVPSDNSIPIYYQLLPESQTGTPLASFSVDKYKLEYVGLISTVPYVGEKYYKTPVLEKTVAIQPYTQPENPVLYSNVIETEGGAGVKKVGYIAYNQFITGFPEWENFDYDNRMKEIFAGFQAAGVDDVVIDLRYNGGGAVSSCLLMSSMLIPQSKLGTNFCKYQRNETVTQKYFSHYSQWQKFLTVAGMSGENYGSAPGVNLNKSKVYVLATGSSASASETLINALRGADVTVYHIGTTTEGKTVGMDLVDEDADGVEYDGVYTDSKSGRKYRYWMRPITFYIYNAKEQADFANGFTPNYMVDETDCESWDWKELGDPEEPLLAAALQHIKTGSFPLQGRSGVSGRAKPGDYGIRAVPNKNDGTLLRRTDLEILKSF